MGVERPPGDVVHVGLNKTATTWLQRVVFPEVASHRLVGRHAHPDRPVLAAVERAQSPDGYVRGELRDALARAGGGRPVLFTDEALTSTLRYPRWDAFQRTAARLHAELPEATILLVVREQASLVASSHRQYVKMGGTAGLARFCSDQDLPGLAKFPERYDLFALYDALRQLYGADRVVVLPFEQLQGDRAAFLGELVDRLGLTLVPGADEAVAASTERNASLSRTGTALLRAANHGVRSRPFHPGRWAVPASPRTTFRWAQRVDHVVRQVPGRARLDRAGAARDRALLAEVADRYAEQNVRLAQAIGLDLGALGYAGMAVAR